MRIDIVSIFPAYLGPLELSLPGKARTTACWTSGSTTSGPGLTTATAPWTTPRTAAAPAW